MKAPEPAHLSVQLLVCRHAQMLLSLLTLGIHCQEIEMIVVLAPHGCCAGRIEAFRILLCIFFLHMEDILLENRNGAFPELYHTDVISLQGSLLEPKAAVAAATS